MTAWTPPVQPVDNPLPPVVVSPYARNYARLHASAHMYYTVSIVRMLDPLFDDVTGLLEATQKLSVYQGPARIWTVAGPQVLGVGEDQLTLRQTYVSIPWDAFPVPNRDDIVTVLTYDVHPFYGDDELIGRTFRVTDVELGGQMYATRRLQVIGLEPSSAWGPDALQ